MKQLFDKQEMTETQIQLYEALTFFTKLLAAGLVFQVILYIYPDTTPAQEFLAAIITPIMDQIMKASFTASGINIVTDGVRYIITQDCLGWKSMAAYTALIFAATNKYRKNLKYILGGIILIYIANIFRIITTIYLSQAGIISFEIIHDTLWKWSLTGIVFILWIIWFEKLRYIDKPIQEFKDYIKNRF